MTRVAILEPDPRICGAVTWALHVKPGLQRMGFEVEIVSPTKSGKAPNRWGVDPRPDHGARWSNWVPDAIPRHDAAAAYLREFDFVILPEPKSSGPDKEAIKAKEKPPYIGWLEKCGRPFITALMGPQYGPQWHCDFMPDLFALPNFVPVIATSQRAFADTNPALQDPRIRYVEHPLPYQPVHPVDAARGDFPIVGFTGRMMPNLGPQLLAAAASQIDAASVELWGSASVGLGANATYVLWKFMIENGWVGERLAHRLNCTNCKRNYDGARMPPGGIVCECGFRMNGEIRPSAWWVQKDGRQVSYFGAYVSEVETCARFNVHVDLTGHDYTWGLEKYTSLEAIDAGCIPVLPDHLNINGFAVKHVAIENPKSITRIERDQANEQLSAVTQACNDALHLSPADRLAAIAYNRQHLIDTNDPLSFVTAWLGAW